MFKRKRPEPPLDKPIDELELLVIRAACAIRAGESPSIEDRLDLIDLCVAVNFGDSRETTLARLHWRARTLLDLMANLRLQKESAQED